MSCVKVKFQDLTCNLAGTRPKAKPVFGRVPFDITPIADGYRYHRRSRLRAPWSVGSGPRTVFRANDTGDGASGAGAKYVLQLVK